MLGCLFRQLFGAFKFSTVCRRCSAASFAATESYCRLRLGIAPITNAIEHAALNACEQWDTPGKVENGPRAHDDDPRSSLIIATLVHAI